MLLAAAIGLLLMALAPEPSRPKAQVKAGVRLESSPIEQIGPLRSLEANVSARSRLPDQLPVDDIVIDSVQVDKSELCKGEQAVVTVKARSKDRGEDYLSYGSPAHPDVVGPRFTLQPTESLGYGWMKVFVRGRFGTTVEANVPPILVKDCEQALTMRIELERKAAIFDRAWLHATVSVHGADAATPFEAVAYDWDFGDGTRETTTEAGVEHSYENRPQTQAYSYFFVTVKARDARGRSVSASRSLRFVNLGFSPLANEERVVVFAGIDTSAEPERIWLYHGAPFPVRIERVTVSDSSVDAPADEDAGAGEDYDPATFLGVAELPAAKSVDLRDLSAWRPTEPGAMRVVEFFGRGPGAKTVSGSFTLVAPNPSLALGESDVGNAAAEERETYNE